jgi:hypothetical protein
MHFTYEDKEKVYKLRNKMNSTVKTMEEVAILYHEDTGEIKDYGSASDMDKRHRNLAESGERQYEMFRTTSLNLEVINKVLNGEANLADVIENKSVATKFFVSYYPVGWKPSLVQKKEKEAPAAPISVGDLVKMGTSSRQYKVVSEKKGDDGKRVLTLDFNGGTFVANESDLEKIS